MLVDLAEQTGAEKIILTSIFPVGELPFYRKPLWSEDINDAITSTNEHLRSLAAGKIVYFDSSQLLAELSGFVQKTYQKDFLHILKQGYKALNRELLPLISVYDH
jgi:hypothetical protein